MILDVRTDNNMQNLKRVFFGSIFLTAIVLAGLTSGYLKFGETAMAASESEKAVFNQRKRLANTFGDYYAHRTSLFEKLPKSNDNIIFLGDSLTDHCEWSELFQNIRLKNRGIGGDTTDGLLNRLDDIVAFQPQKLFIMIGINDLLKGLAAERILANYRKIIELVQERSPNTKLYLQSVLPVKQSLYYGKKTNDEIQKLNDQLLFLSRELNVEFIDLHAQFVDPTGQLNSRYSRDGLHLNGSGYLLWKNAIEKYVNN